MMRNRRYKRNEVTIRRVQIPQNSAFRVRIRLNGNKAIIPTRSRKTSTTILSLFAPKERTEST